MRVMITGAGGSIGGALCRKLHEQGHDLVLFEQSEYALYQINKETGGKHLAVLGDVKDRSRLLEFMDGVEAIFHCAAYKHVPMCEAHNAEVAYKNNVEGTKSVLEAGKSAKSIVLLSTDKAINPLSVMGKTKLDAEKLTLDYGRTIGRLGNILESSGSVIPLFREQIAQGGPVTVTHPETTRYFIEMDNAVDFLIDCSKRDSGAYQIDMGEPRKILDIANEMIGNKDIEIKFIGLRPGEKLHEDIN